MTIEIIVNRSELREKSAQIQNAILEGVREAAEEIAEFLADFTDPGWADYSPLTLVKRTAEGLGSTPDLSFSGEMKNSVRTSTKDNGAIISAIEKAIFHEFGTAIGMGRQGPISSIRDPNDTVTRMPARPWLTNSLIPYTQTVEERIKNKLAEI